MNLLDRFFKASAPSIASVKDSINNVLEDIASFYDGLELEEVFDKEMERAKKTISNLTKKIKNLTDRYIVSVPYDRDSEKLSYVIEGRELEVTVTALDGTKENSLAVSLPEDVIVTEVTQKYNAEEKKMEFSFKKKIETDEPQTTEEEIHTEEVTEEVATEEEAPLDEPIPTETETSEVEESASALHNLINEALEQHEIVTDVEKDKCELARQMATLRASGWSYKRIGREFGVADKTVAKWIRKHAN